MRSDAIGIFWQDMPRKKGDRTARVMPPIPETEWTPPTEFPNLSGARIISLDVETKDPELKKHGPGWARKRGHLAGIAVGTEDGGRWYFPMRHEVQKEYNMDPDRVLSWARDTLQNPRQPKVGANLFYDVGWLREEGVHVAGFLYDVQFAEALLTENSRVALDILAHKYLGEGKESKILYEWCSSFYGGKPTASAQGGNIYRAPPSLVGPYAESDVDRPLRIIQEQWPLLQQQGLTHLFEMECRLIYLMVEMRFQGVAIDLDRAEQLKAVMEQELAGIDRQLKALVGFGVNTNANDSLAKAFDRLGLGYGFTKPSKNYPQGRPSFTKTFLKSVDHELTKLILKKRAREKLMGTFIQSYLLDSHVDGRVHCQFHQLRSDDGGARSGRFSSSTPNLQNIPIRSELGKKIRTAFIPDYGHAWWEKIDYSQIEYRALAHYAVGPGADEVRRRYNEDPATDFHVAVQEIIREVVGLDLDRPLVKNINFGSTYGMGQRKLAAYLGLTREEAKELFNAIHSAAPFLRETMDATTNEADRLGYITTILGRRSRFDLWVPEHYDEDARPITYDEAILRYANPKRAYLHKALNRRLQGSAADLIKKAMLDCWEGGLFDEVGVPRLTVHDELDFSHPGGHEETFREIYHTMETAIEFRVPVQVGIERGPSWGAVEDVDRLAA